MAGEICFDVVIDAGVSKLSYGAFIGVSVVPAKQEHFLQAATEIPEFWYVARAIGRHDAILFVGAKKKNTPTK